MAKYNAANHTIETDAGELLARLERSIRSDEGFEIADNWGSSATAELHNQIEDLGCEVQRAVDKTEEVQKELDDANDEIKELEEKLEEARAKIEELQDQITELEAEKGDAQ